MDIQFGVETEIGISREKGEGLDVVSESIALVRSATAPSTIAPPAMDHGPGRSPVPSRTQSGLHTGSSIEMRLASAAGTLRTPRANIQYETPSCMTPR